MMKTQIGLGLCALAALTIPLSALAQDAGQAPQQAERAEHVQAAAAPDQACEQPKKKKKGLGLGGLLRSARSSGLLGAVAGRAGADGYLVNSAANTAIDIGTAEAQQQQQQAPRAQEVQSC